MKKILILLLFSLNCFGSNKSFEWLEPVDKPIADKMEWENKHLAHVLSNFVVYTNMALPYLYFADKNENKKLLAYTGAILTNTGLVRLTKVFADRTRPNGENDNSFYSGHTSMSFISAGFLCREATKEMCISSLLLAGATGYLRLAARKHWFSDVTVGAFMGYTQGYYIPTLLISF